MDFQKRPKIGVAVLVLHDGKILLGKRKGTHGAGMWEAPGGHLEYGETIEECAIRELKEETGLSTPSADVIDWVENPAKIGNRHYVTFFALVQSFSGTPTVCEKEKSEGWEWFSIENLPSPLFSTIPLLLEKREKNELIGGLC